MIGKQVKWIIFGWLGCEWVKGVIVDITSQEDCYVVEGQTLFGQKHSDVKNISELTFC